ncbi:hypothetical protein CEXT_724501 [Caerostris extrusa]|uniref:Uncharacterized protein n=1 Tax=Caerostris extrusa TaxID=172846 RepID=A0AAV4QS94_CAEEX|nr:hypothetical protein CEXT_724501 [Caerostris extrusa]
MNPVKFLSKPKTTNLRHSPMRQKLLCMPSGSSRIKRTLEFKNGKFYSRIPSSLSEVVLPFSVPECNKCDRKIKKNPLRIFSDKTENECNKRDRKEQFMIKPKIMKSFNRAVFEI